MCRRACVCVCITVVGGCVGYRNNKAFVQMIVYGMIGLALACGIFGYGVKRSVEVDEPSLLRVIPELILCVVYLCLFFAFRLFQHKDLFLSFHFITSLYDSFSSCERDQMCCYK